MDGFVRLLNFNIIFYISSIHYCWSKDVSIVMLYETVWLQENLHGVVPYTEEDENLILMTGNFDFDMAVKRTPLQGKRSKKGW